MIPEPVARNHNIIAFKKNSDSLEVAMLDTADLPSNFVKEKGRTEKSLPRLTDTESMKERFCSIKRRLKMSLATSS
ncbi:MAG: hypothetical protein R3B69_01055 [Candidatus Paceibacterota bacterium]